ncbi:MAG: hypothetical protein ACKON7_03665 [Planctomycetaceae bacterium]
MGPKAVSDDKKSAPDAAVRDPSFEGNRIVFFCSNGHRIEVDRAWAGKHGTCSKQGCSVPVVIPVPPGLARPAEASHSSAGAMGPALPTAGVGTGQPSTDAGPEAATDATGWGVDFDAIDHPTARLVAALWRERAHGGVVEVHLTGGSVMMPQWYDPLWSCGTHALFAAPCSDGTVMLTAVAWDQVQKVVVRQLRYVPEDMFPG